MDGFGERVRLYRERHKLTQEELARKIGLPDSAISKIENGTQQLRVRDALAMAQLYNVDIATFLGQTPPAPLFLKTAHAAQMLSPLSRKEYADLLRTIADEVEAMKV